MIVRPLDGIAAGVYGQRMAATDLPAHLQPGPPPAVIGSTCVAMLKPGDIIAPSYAHPWGSRVLAVWPHPTLDGAFRVERCDGALTGQTVETMAGDDVVELVAHLRDRVARP